MASSRLLSARQAVERLREELAAASAAPIASEHALYYLGRVNEILTCVVPAAPPEPCIPECPPTTDTLPPDSEDVVAAIAYADLLRKHGDAETVDRYHLVVSGIHDIYRAWIKTLDLGGEDDHGEPPSFSQPGKNVPSSREQPVAEREPIDLREAVADAIAQGVHAWDCGSEVGDPFQTLIGFDVHGEQCRWSAASQMMAPAPFIRFEGRLKVWGMPAVDTARFVSMLREAAAKARAER